MPAHMHTKTLSISPQHWISITFKLLWASFKAVTIYSQRYMLLYLLWPLCVCYNKPHSLSLQPSSSTSLSDAGGGGSDLYRLHLSLLQLPAFQRCVCVRETESVQWKEHMNNSADALTRPPSIKPSPLMSLNDSHRVETIKGCVCMCEMAERGWVGGKRGNIIAWKGVRMRCSNHAFCPLSRVCASAATEQPLPQALSRLPWVILPETLKRTWKPSSQQGRWEEKLGRVEQQRGAAAVSLLPYSSSDLFVGLISKRTSLFLLLLVFAALLSFSFCLFDHLSMLTGDFYYSLQPSSLTS